jgi:hypothetical protein
MKRRHRRESRSAAKGLSECMGREGARLESYMGTENRGERLRMITTNLRHAGLSVRACLDGFAERLDGLCHSVCNKGHIDQGMYTDAWLILKMHKGKNTGRTQRAAPPSVLVEKTGSRASAPYLDVTVNESIILNFNPNLASRLRAPLS